MAIKREGGGKGLAIEKKNNFFSAFLGGSLKKWKAERMGN